MKFRKKSKIAIIIISLIVLSMLCSLAKSLPVKVYTKKYDLEAMVKEFEQRIELSVDETKIGIKILKNPNITHFGTYLGKGILQQSILTKVRTAIKDYKDQFPLMNENELKNKIDSLNIILDIETNEDIDFVLFYLCFPPGKGLLLNNKAKWTIIFRLSSNHYQLFSLLTTGSIKEDGLTNLILFYPNAQVIVPKGGICLLEKTLKDARKIFPELKVEIKSIIDFIKKKISESELESFLKPSNKKFHEIKNSFPVFDDKIENVTLNKNEVIYAPSDETTHIWKEEKTIYIVDAGSQPLSSGIQTILSIEDDEYNKIIIAITHTHNDHVQALASLIEIEYSKKKEIIILIHEDIKLEFAGWLLKNLLRATYKKDLTRHPKFELVICKKGETCGEKFPNIRPIMHHDDKDFNMSNKIKDYKENPYLSLRHFITSTTWSFVKYNCHLVFSGDINPPVVYDIDFQEDDMKNYFHQILKELGKKTNVGNCVNFFFDYGHFNMFDTKSQYFSKYLIEHDVYIDTTFTAVRQTPDSKYKLMKIPGDEQSSYRIVDGKEFFINFYIEHIKTEDGYSLSKAELKGREGFTNEIVVETRRRKLFK